MNLIEQIAVSEQIGMLAAGTEKEGSAAALFGVQKIHRSLAAAAYYRVTGRPVVLVCDTDMDAFKAAEDIRSLGLEDVAALPSRELTLMDVEGMSRNEEMERLSVFAKATLGKLKIVCCSVESLCLKTIPAKEYKSREIYLATGGRIEPKQLIKRLVGSGYSRCDRVEGRGQFALRGDILDIYPVDRDQPCRIEFFDDEVERIFTFFVDTQRRDTKLDNIVVPAAREITFGEDAQKAMESLSERISEGELKKAVQRDLTQLMEGIPPVCTDRYLNACYEEPETIVDYLKNCVLFLCEKSALEERYKNLMQRHGFDIESLGEKNLWSRSIGEFYEDYISLTVKHSRVYCDVFTKSLGDVSLSSMVNLKGNSVPRWNGDTEMLREDLRGYISMGYHCAVMAGTEKAAKAMAEDLSSFGIEARVCTGTPALEKGTAVAVIPAPLSSGFEITPLKIMVISCTAVGGQVKRDRVAAKKKNPNAFGSLEELRAGDYVVHEKYGIGQYQGINRVDYKGYVSDFITIVYRDSSRLYVPVTELDQVSPYITPNDVKNVKLDKLGSDGWQKTKQKVYSSAREMAKELIELYAKREHTSGIAFSGDTAWQRDFEARFPFEETEDQLRSAEEIKQDMEKGRPMDRLLCGDVGVGKTEVALRAAFRCVTDGYQVAILCPTTILALQHYQTLLERMEGFPVKCAMLSRFTSAKETKDTVAGIKSGRVDIVVGTHKLLQKSVEFRKLGLLIVDEEQRFGVAHKEKLKEKFPKVDVLTLSATPIPRTLSMAMNGIRDMSTIESYPVDRHPIQTYVVEYDEGTIYNAIKRELARGGQVYYLHNRVETIDTAAGKLAKMLPDARIEIAHGQMGEEQLSEVWKRLVDGECDILVCTTIIETGVDVPNCNTLIVEDADNLGLAQLYQIRGRVGRSSRRAYAWLTYRKDKVLTEVSSKRLAAIRDFTSFGSGFRIAMRDLQIRGAGSVLSSKQSGHIQSVGYETYMRILDRAVRDEQGLLTDEEQKECKISLMISAYIPEEYIPDNESRIEMYKRIADIRNKEDFKDVSEELEDRFGPMPISVKQLCEVSSCRASAADLGIVEVKEEGEQVKLFSDNYSKNQVIAAAKTLPGRVYYVAKDRKHMVITKQRGEQLLDSIFEVLEVLREVGSEKETQ